MCLSILNKVGKALVDSVAVGLEKEDKLWQQGFSRIPRWKELCAVYQEEQQDSQSEFEVQGIKNREPFFFALCSMVGRTILSRSSRKKIPSLHLG